MPVTPTDVDAAVPSAGTPVRSLTNAVLKGLITDIAAVGVGVGVGTVNTYADLPAPATVTGERWWVLTSTGIWLVNRRTKGAYYSDGAVWSYLGDFPVTAVEIGNTPAGGISAVNVQAALDELDTDKASTAVFTSSTNGLTPASGGGTTNYLRADGTWQPAGGGSSDPITLANAPGTPASGSISVGNAKIATFPFLAFKGASGLVRLIQPFIGTIPMMGVSAFGSNQLISVGSGNTTVGSVAAVNTASTNAATRTPRVNLPSAAAAGSLCSIRATSTSVHSGNATFGGGFFHIGIIVPTTTVSDMRLFSGLQNQTGAPTNVNPSTLTNAIGIAAVDGSANLHIVFGGSVAQTPIDLGPNFPSRVGSADKIQYAFYWPPGSNSTLHYEVNRNDGAFIASGSITNTTPGTTLPADSTSLSGLRFFASNNATASAVTIGISTLLTLIF